MPEIIYHGRKPEDRVYRATCNNCRTIADFKEVEGKRVSDQREGESITFTCPVCAKLIWHHIKGISQQWDR